MDWMLFFTAVMALSTVAAMVAGVFAHYRSADIKSIDGKFTTLTNEMNNVYTAVQAKLDKHEHQQALARIDRELDQMRSDQKDDISRIDTKLDKIYDVLIKVSKS